MQNVADTRPTKTIAPARLRWWKTHGRKDLPWQQNPTPYRVWVSEIMLQQTQVATVDRYFDLFIAAFPDVTALANATADQVLHLWSGLGYYGRGRNLHRAAGLIRDQYTGVLPISYDELLKLPGVGRSTAGAILALSRGQRVPILDGNARRVLLRVHGIADWPGSASVAKRLWGLAEASTPERRVAQYTQAIMDLGATVCTGRNPHCKLCPLASICVARATGLVAQIPARRPRKSRPRKTTALALAIVDNRVLLEKRAPSGIWGGLWSFPELPNPDAVSHWCQARFGRPPVTIKAWPVISHSFSHFDLDMTPVEISIDGADGQVMDGDRWLWYNTEAPAEIGLAAPVAQLLQAIGDRK
jgi:A/G-specific adenine glycosylase